MNTYVIPVDDSDRISEFLKHYNPTLQTESRQRTLLKKKVEEAEIVPVDKLPRTIVTMDSQVRLRDISSHESTRYILVYPKHASNGMRRLSVLSPLGAALLGRAEGDVVELATPFGMVQFSIQEVLYQPQWEKKNRFRNDADLSVAEAA